MLRVLMLSTDLERGGLPLRFVRLARLLPRFGVEPVVGCLAPAGPLSNELRAAGIATFACGMKGLRDAPGLLRLAQHLREVDPDVVHAALFHANLAARMVGRCDRMRPIITSTVTIEIERRWHRWLEALTGSMSDLHVANSQAVADHLCEELGFERVRVAVVPNAVDVGAIDAARPADRARAGIPPGVVLLVWAGRIDPIKNLEVFVDVVHALHAMREVRGVILGDGPDMPRLKHYVRQKHLGGVVHLPGWADAAALAGWLKAADVLVFPSLTEGAPNVVLEAMAARCPVVASRIPAHEWLIGDNCRGLLCAAADVAAFRHAVERLVADARLRKRVTAAGRGYVVERHGQEQVGREWVSHYRRVVETADNTAVSNWPVRS